MTSDEQYMFRCLELARKGLGMTAPNPMVGAVLVHQDRIIGEGCHRVYGGPHAEVNALESVYASDRILIPDSTLYVSLEPCAHVGLTPPCADRIIQEGIPNVVVACRDPFPRVNGKGIEALEAAGVHVRLGVMESQAEELNRRFLTFHRRNRPYVILKWAQSADGMIAAAGPRQAAISNAWTRQLVHQWRYEEAAIMVGARTVEVDDPQLTVRPGSSPRQPVRIVVDPLLRLHGRYRVFDTGASVIVCNTLREGRQGHIRYLQVADTVDLLPDILEGLYTAGIQSILVEGGRILLESFLRLGAWDEVRRITATDKRIPGGWPGPSTPLGIPVGIERHGSDLIETFRHG